MSDKKVVLFRCIWSGGKLVGTPKPTPLAPLAAKNVLSVIPPGDPTPAWVTEADLRKLGFDVEKKENGKSVSEPPAGEGAEAANAEPPAEKKAKRPTSVEQSENQ